MGEHQMFSEIIITTKSKFTLDGDFPGFAAREVLILAMNLKEIGRPQ